MGGVESALGEPERWINVCFSPAVAACVWLIKGRYTGLQSVTINNPSSGRHAGGPPHKDSPYGVSPATSKCFIRVPSPYTQLLNWRVFKQPHYCQQARELIKIFSASAFPRKEGEMRRRRRGGEGRASRPGNRGGGGAGGPTSRRDAMDRATAVLHAFIPLSMSNYLRISPSLLDCAPSPPSSPREEPVIPTAKRANDRRGVACRGLGSWDNSNRPGHRRHHTNRWHLNSFDTYFKSCSASELH